MRLRRGAAAPALVALAAFGAAAGHAAAADPILPLSEVHPGMVGEARTVVRGTDIVRFPVTVIDIQRSTDGPGGTQILARAEGPLIASTGGVAQGMSGSPVYVTGADGVERVIGAVAFGTGDEANVLIGLTPIEQMIDSSSGQRELSRAPSSTGAVRRMVRVRDRAAAVRLQRRRPDLIGTYPLARWTLDGSLAPAGRPALGELAEVGHPARLDRPPHPPAPGDPAAGLVDVGAPRRRRHRPRGHRHGDLRRRDQDPRLRPPLPRRRPTRSSWATATSTRSSRLPSPAPATSTPSPAPSRG